MYTITGKIEGVAPLLFGAFADPGVLDTPAQGGIHTKEHRLEEAEARAYRDENGLLYLPARNFKCCLLDGCKKAKLKSGQFSLAPFLEATIFPDHRLRFLTHPTDYDFMHEAQGRRPPRTGKACIIRRPALDVGWQLAFKLAVVDDRQIPDLIHRSLSEGGIMVGLCDWRPEYGRFIVTEWEVQKED